MNIAVIGGGINGVMAAWELAKQGFRVDLFERDALMRATSSASTKMLHGGLRYLEHGHFSLVREALQERAWWINQAPHLAHPFELALPLYKTGRSRLTVFLGVKLYEMLALGSGFPQGRWLGAKDVQDRFPSINAKGLVGAYTYWDAQMDDYRLGLWAAQQARLAGVEIFEHTYVREISPEGWVKVDKERKYDRVVNVAGPWAEELLKKSDIQSEYSLNLIRGTHLVINREVHMGCVLQVPGEKRVIFLLPYEGKALLGTTEVVQPLTEPIEPSSLEIEYLISSYNQHFSDYISRTDISSVFTGLRPVVAASADCSSASRESVIERNGNLINVFGGKWTTSRALAKKIANKVIQ